ncbi:uncharacterized protein PITG_20887 [Phytophthora infestans T30-4]|uniref:Uncharacterized protein n=1 Tax=Phytophthora infestans (strain T30-4) TaxID=403677 RepID=D0P247_PHYIT|nr:uncharacterized protein PITG_20887 [Phytophthora infestans T30-4]EEY55473.1 conserved hypothetical protein [Phytophthora infestans T30-4]|eukprot:XP_002895635.1 conserved hypothetical protein [Phytophthora infestans T30-4]
MTSQATSFQDLLHVGISTDTHVIKKETRDVYASYLKKFCEFCISNKSPDPATARHHELLASCRVHGKRITFVSVSNQTADTIWAAVANYYGNYERRDEAGSDK